MKQHLCFCAPFECTKLIGRYDKRRGGKGGTLLETCVAVGEVSMSETFLITIAIVQTNRFVTCWYYSTNTDIVFDCYN